MDLVCLQQSIKFLFNLIHTPITDALILPHHASLVNIETPNTLILGISWLQIAHADEYPTMHHFGIPRPTQWIAYTCIFIQD